MRCLSLSESSGLSESIDESKFGNFLTWWHTLFLEGRVRCNYPPSPAWLLIHIDQLEGALDCLHLRELWSFEIATVHSMHITREGYNTRACARLLLCTRCARTVYYTSAPLSFTLLISSFRARLVQCGLGASLAIWHPTYTHRPAKVQRKADLERLMQSLSILTAGFEAVWELTSPVVPQRKACRERASHSL